MHCEKNITENILKTTFGEKDTPAVRVDLQARGIRPHLHLQALGPNGDRYYMPDASYVLSTNDKAKVLRVLKSLRTLRVCFAQKNQQRETKWTKVTRLSCIVTTNITIMFS